MTGLDRVLGGGRVRTALGLFLRRWLSNPRSIGAVAPSAPGLTRRMAREAVLRDDQAVVELGPGTGTVTRALLAAGVPEDRLILVEFDAEMAEYLSDRFPEAVVLNGDAADLDSLVPARWAGQVSTVVSSLPLLSFPVEIRARIAAAVFAVLGSDGRLVQYTYGPGCPLSRAVPGVKGRRTGFAALNIPPATVWCYEAPEKESPRASAN